MCRRLYATQPNGNNKMLGMIRLANFSKVQIIDYISLKIFLKTFLTKNIFKTCRNYHLGKTLNPLRMEERYKRSEQMQVIISGGGKLNKIGQPLLKIYLSMTNYKSFKTKHAERESTRLTQAQTCACVT